MHNKIIQNKEELFEKFHSNEPLKAIAVSCNMSRQLLRDLWIEQFGISAVNHRSKYIQQILRKNKHKIKKNNINANEIIQLFNTKKSLKEIEKEYNIDQRKIRIIWRKEFGKTAVTKRGKEIAIFNIERLNENIINQIGYLIENGMSILETSKKLNISRVATAKYILLKFPHLRRSVAIQTTAGRSATLKKTRSKDTITQEEKNKVMEYFNTDLFPIEIAKNFNLCVNSIYKIFKECAGKKKYEERKKKLNIKRITNLLKALEIAGKLGSKPEINFYKTLKKCLNVEIIHHDYDICPPYEIDITIPKLKIAIFWDGIGHFKPIFGNNSFKKVLYRDKYKKQYLENIGWNVFIVKDLNSGINEKFNLEQKYLFLQLLKNLGFSEVIKND